MRPVAGVGVVIPAHDEQDTIGDAIDSVLRSLAEVDVRRSVLVVVCDDCGDRTAAVAREHLRPEDRAMEVGHRCVGAARAAGSLAALRFLDLPPEQVWLLSIDADSTAPPSWVRHHLGHADSGADCVAGVVELAHDAPRHLGREFHRRYTAELSSVPGTHDHVHGTNLGVRASTLLDAGNWAPLRTGEDHATWAAVGAVGGRRVQDPRISVVTSSRLVGRAPHGFAADLRELLASARDAVALARPTALVSITRRG